MIHNGSKLSLLLFEGPIFGGINLHFLFVDKFKNHCPRQGCQQESTKNAGHSISKALEYLRSRFGFFPTAGLGGTPRPGHDREAWNSPNAQNAQGALGTRNTQNNQNRRKPTLESPGTLGAAVKPETPGNQRPQWRGRTERRERQEHPERLGRQERQETKPKRHRASGTLVLSQSRRHDCAELWRGTRPSFDATSE